MNKDLDSATASAVAGEVMSALAPLSRRASAQPHLAVVLEVIKGTALLGFATHFARLRKYNLAELAKG